MKNIIKIINLKNQTTILEKMDELVTKTATGIYNCTTNQKVMTEKMDECLADHAEMTKKMNEIATQTSNNENYNFIVNARLTELELKVADIYEAIVTKE